MARTRSLAATLGALVLLLLTSLSGAQSGWQLIPAGNAPPLRYYGTSVLYDDTSDRLIMFGGHVAGTTTNDVWVLPNAFAGGSRTWIKLNPTGAVPQGRANHGAVYDSASNRLIIFGGCTGACSPVTNDVRILEYANGLGGTPNWIQPVIGGAAPSARHNVAVGYDPTLNTLIVFGGQNGSGQISAFSTFGDTWMLTNANGLGGASQWHLAQAAGGPAGRYGPTGVYDTSARRLIVIGGITANASQANATWIFNATSPTTGYWQNTIAEGASGSPPVFSSIEAAYDAANRRVFVPILNPATQTKDIWILENESSWRKLSPPFLSRWALGVDGTMFQAASNMLLSFFSTDIANELWAITPELNAAPSFIAPTPGDGSSFTVRAGQNFDTTVTASDPDSGDTVTISVAGLPAGANSGTNGPANPANRDVSWRPGYQQTGSHTLHFTAQDTRGGSASTSITINVTPNTPPVFGGPTPFAPFNVPAGSHVSFTVQAVDADSGDGFTVDVDTSTLPAGASSSGSGFGNPASRAFSWTPANTDAGARIVRFSATDLAGATTEHAVTINVTPNNPPVFVAPTPVAPLSVIAGTPLSFTVTAIDNDPNQSLQLMVNFSTVPSGMSVGPDQGTNPVEKLFSWTPQSSNAGSHTISITAKDNFNATASASITINVLPVTLVSLAVTPSSASRHFGSQTFTATGTFSDGSSRQLQSGTPTNVSAAPMWEVLFSPMINATPCATSQYPASAIGNGWASQNIIDHGGAVDEVWSAYTPVLDVDGTINPTSVSLALNCTNSNASGSITASWTGTRYEGTYSFGASTGNVVLTGWSAKASMPGPRFGHGAATVGSTVYAIGGVSGVSVLDTVESYDPSTNTWRGNLAPMPTPRSGHGVVAVNGLIYAVGGSIPGDIPSGVLEAYDPSTDSWTTGLAPMPTPRAYLSAVEAGGQLYVIGGHNGANNSNPLPALERYDPATNVWTTLPPMPTPDHFTAAGVLGTTIVVVGGGGTQKYDLASGTWSAGVAYPGGINAAAGGVTNGGFFVFGGQNGNGLISNSLVYYPQSQIHQEGWSWMGAMPTPRSELAAAVVGDVVYAIGGQTLQQPPAPGVATLTVLSTPPFGHLQTGFSGMDNGPTVQWSSSNPAVATIDASGTAQAVSPGQTTIIASSGNITCAGIQCATFTVTNAAPTVQINNGPFTKNEGGNSLFIGASFSDPDGDSVTRQWSIVSGPGFFTGGSNGFNVNYQNNDGPGTATIQLTVTDSYGAFATATTSVTTNNVNPGPPNINFPNTVLQGQLVTGSGNFTDPGADSWVVTVNYGDGSGDQIMAAMPDKTFALSHQYAAAGSYTLRVRVTDDDGGSSPTSFRTITVNQPVSAPTFSQVPDTPAGACICTPRSNLINQGAHVWFVKADASGLLKVTVVTPVVGAAAQTVEAQLFDAGNSQIGQTSISYPANSDPDGEFRSDMTVAAAPGAIYRVRVRAPGQQFFARYWLRFDGAVETGIGSPSFPSVEGGFMTWLMNVDAADALALRLFTQGVPQGDTSDGPVVYQWIAPNGEAEPAQSFHVTVPAPPAFVDTMIPGPAGLSPGIWKLRLFADFDYRLDKKSGADRGLYLDHQSAGRGGIKLNLVDGNGDPFLETVNMTVTFGQPFFSIPIENGVFEVSDAEAFSYHVQLTVPAGYEASMTEFDIVVTCDELTEITIVIAPPKPPSLSLQLSPTLIWPPNNKLVPITATIAASSPNGHATVVELLNIANNESGSADVEGAAIGTDDRTFAVRATRNGGGSGRTYTVTYRATDSVTGATATASATLLVPHDQRK